MADVRHEFRKESAAAVPAYSLVLPNGWQEFEPTAEGERDLSARVTSRLMRAHRPDLLAQSRPLMSRAFAGMRRAETVRFYVQTEAWRDELLLPLSLTASVRRARGGGTLDARVSELIRDKGATALRDDRRFVRWESATVETLGGERVRQFTTAYLTPIPETGRSAGLQFTAVAIAPADDVERDHPLVTAMGQLADAIVSTLDWALS